MSIASEITRLQNAKTTLKTKLNSRNDNQHQITNELIDEYGDFVDSIPSGGSGGIDWSQIGYSAEPQTVTDGFNYAKTIYDNWDNTQTELWRKFKDDKNLIYMPLVDTSNATGMSEMFYDATHLEYLPNLDTSKVTYFTNFLYGNVALESIPQIDTSSATSIHEMFRNTKLVTVGELNCENVIECNNPFASSVNLTNFGGFKDLGKAYLTTRSANYTNYRVVLNNSTKITHDSLMNVINNLYDIATKGCNTQQLILGSTNLAKLSAEEISTATNKGWSVS